MNLDQLRDLSWSEFEKALCETPITFLRSASPKKVISLIASDACNEETKSKTNNFENSSKLFSQNTYTELHQIAKQVIDEICNYQYQDI